MHPKTLTPKIHRVWLGSLLALFAASNPLSAQTVVAPSASDVQPSPGVTTEQQKIEVLSPFVVSSEKDTGYQATSTLAGTRLNTPIKDLGAAISIYTKDFMSDIGALDSTDLLVYATDMETAGAQGNYSGVADGPTVSYVIGDAVRYNPQSTARTRGLATPSFTRDYFPTSITFDSYNTDRVTVNRGPNAALFGVGNPGGVIDTTMSTADLNGDKTSFQTRFGQNSSLRDVLDFNRVLINGKLAARLVLLDDNNRYNQQPAFETRKRIYGAIIAQPFKNTLLHANFESGNTSANRPISALPFNSVSPAWYAAGRPTFDWTYFDDPARDPTAKADDAYGSSSTIPSMTMGIYSTYGTIFTFNQPYATQPSKGFVYRINPTSSNIPNDTQSNVFNPIFNKDLGTDYVPFLTTLNYVEMPVTYWTGATLPAGQQPGYTPVGMKAPTFSNYSAFDWKDKMIDQTSRQGDSFHTYNISFSQTAWNDRLGLELAYDRQRIDRHAKNGFFSGNYSNAVYVDPNVTLVDGTPNPNLGRPFTDTAYSDFQDSSEDREGERATGYVKYDFADLNNSWGKWLGHHTLTVLDETTSTVTFSEYWREALQGDASFAARSESGNIYNAYGRAPFVVYLGPSIIGNNNSLQLQAITGPSYQAGALSSGAGYFERAADLVDPGHWQNASATLVDILDSGSGVREIIKSQAANLQSYFLKDHLITLLSWRKDSDYYAAQNITYLQNPNDLNDPGKAHYGLNDFNGIPGNPPLFASKEIKSYSGVLSWPQEWIRLPMGTDFSIFYNDSQNFTPVAGRVTPYDVTLASPAGRTKEWGLNFAAFNGKLSLRLNWFETAIKNASFTPSLVGATIQTQILQVAQTWSMEENFNPGLSRAGDIATLFSALPANFRQLYQFTTTGVAPHITTNITYLSGVADTTDYSAAGLEADLTYNPTRNWRILLNVAKQATIQTNMLPFMKAFGASQMAVWNQLRPVPDGNYTLPQGWVVGDPLPTTGYTTFGNQLDRNYTTPMAAALATEGVVSPEQRKWRVNLVNNYSFDRSSIFGYQLTGWSIGAGYRWQDKIAVGFPGTRDTLGVPHFDIAHPIYAPAETNVDGWVAYERMLGRHLKWKLQLNIRNLISSSDLIATSAQSWDGSIATYRLPPDKDWYLTNTLSY